MSSNILVILEVKNYFSSERKRRIFFPEIVMNGLGRRENGRQCIPVISSKFFYFYFLISIDIVLI